MKLIIPGWKQFEGATKHECIERWWERSKMRPFGSADTLDQFIDEALTGLRMGTGQDIQVEGDDLVARASSFYDVVIEYGLAVADNEGDASVN